MIIAPDVKVRFSQSRETSTSDGNGYQWVTTKATKPPPDVLKPKNTSNGATAPQAKPTAPSVIAPKKAGTLDFKAKPKADSKPVVKMEPSVVKAADASTSKKAGAAAKPVVMKEEDVDEKPDLSASTSNVKPTAVQKLKSEASTARPASKQTTARPASKQTTAMPASKQTTAKPASRQVSSSKRVSSAMDSEEGSEDEPSRKVRQKLASDTETTSRRTSTASTASTSRMVVSDEEEEAPIRGPKATAKKLKSRVAEDSENEEELGEASSSKKSRVVRGEAAAEKKRQERAKVQDELKKLALQSGKFFQS